MSAPIDELAPLAARRALERAPDRAPKTQPHGSPVTQLNLATRSPRRIGVELEFARLSVAEAAEVVERVFGGEVTQEEPHAATVATERDGAFKIALDTRHAQKCADETDASQQLRKWFCDVAALVVPVEVALPPLPESRLGDVQRLIDALRRTGAEGTNSALLYAFGTHLNVEMTVQSAPHALDTLRAYLLLEDWLRARIDVNPTRSAIGFEAPFPMTYQSKVLSRSYEPDQKAFIADYIEANPSRNRGLDLLPVLAHLDAAAVEASLPDEKIAARPAFHYRLPNSQVDEKGWKIRDELALWRRVERLAADTPLLERAMDRFSLEAGAGGDLDRARTSFALGERLDREASI